MHQKIVPILGLCCLIGATVHGFIDYATVQNGLNSKLSSIHRTGDSTLLEQWDIPEVAEDINHIITTIIRTEQNLKVARKKSFDEDRPLSKTAQIIHERFASLYNNTIINSCLDDMILNAQKEKLPNTFSKTLCSLINYESCYVYSSENGNDIYHQPFLYPCALFFLQVLSYILGEQPEGETLELYLENLHHRISIVIGQEVAHEHYSSPLGNTKLSSILQVFEKDIASFKKEADPSITQSAAKAVETLGNISFSDSLASTIRRLREETYVVAAGEIAAYSIAGFITVVCITGAYKAVKTASSQ